MKKIVLILVLVLFFINAGFCFAGEPESRPPEVPKQSVDKWTWPDGEQFHSINEDNITKYIFLIL